MSSPAVAGTDVSPIDEILAALDPNPDRLVVRNEFAVVGITLQQSACGTRLRVEDLRTRQSVDLDALELESLAWAQHRDLTPLLDPSTSRWVNAKDE